MSHICPYVGGVVRKRANSTATGLMSKPMNRRPRITDSRAAGPYKRIDNQLTRGTELFNKICNWLVWFLPPIFMETVQADVAFRCHRLGGCNWQLIKSQRFLHYHPRISKAIIDQQEKLNCYRRRQMKCTSNIACKSMIGNAVMRGVQEWHLLIMRLRPNLTLFHILYCNGTADRSDQIAARLPCHSGTGQPSVCLRRSC